MTTTNAIDVLIIGAGPVGLFCAYELHRQGLTFRIIDKKSGLSDKSKALGLHIRSLDLLKDTGFLDEVLKQGHPVKGVYFKSGGKTLVQTGFTELKASHDFLIDLPQSQTEAILNQGLTAQGIKVEWDTALTHLEQRSDTVEATVRKADNKIEIIQADWLIACDGAHSTVRHELKAEFEGAEYPQKWWLADLHLDWEMPEDHMVIYVTRQGPLACFPMGDRRYRLVMLAPEGVDKDPDLSEVIAVFKERSSDPAMLSKPVWLSQFTLHHRQIQHYRHDRVFFAGDAAHIHSPMGGQGLNTGLQDVYNLVWKLALVQKNLANEKVLDSYQLERYPVGHEVLKKTHIMTKLILLSNPVAVWFRNRVISLLTSFSWLRNAMARDLAELTISYAKSPIVSGSGHLGEIQAGAYLPELSLQKAGEQQGLESSLDFLQGSDHHLLLFMGLSNKNPDEIAKLAERMLAQYPKVMKVHLISILPGQSAPPACQGWIDPQGQMHRRFHIKKPAAVLVRPDKYLGFLQAPLREKQLYEYLECWFIPNWINCEKTKDD